MFTLIGEIDKIENGRFFSVLSVVQPKGGNRIVPDP